MRENDREDRPAAGTGLIFGAVTGLLVWLWLGDLACWLLARLFA